MLFILASIAIICMCLFIFVVLADIECGSENINMLSDNKIVFGSNICSLCHRPLPPKMPPLVYNVMVCTKCGRPI